jgi:lysophospholipase L1-like esterase
MKRLLVAVSLVLAALGAGYPPSNLAPSPNAGVSLAPGWGSASPLGAVHRAAGGSDGTSRFVFAGDSITAGGLVAQFARLDAQVGYRLCPSACPGRIENDGVGGSGLVTGSVPQLATTLPPIIDRMSPGDILHIMIGMNDIFNYPGDVAWTTAYVGLVDYAQARGIHVILGQITPIGPNHSPQEPLRERLNKWLVDHYGASVLQYSNLLQDWGLRNPYVDVRYGWPDGIHVDEGAYVLMANMIYAQVTGAGWWAS